MLWLPVIYLNFYCKHPQRQKQKAAAAAIMNFTVALAFALKVSGNVKSKASNLALDLFTWSFIFYDAGYLWCMILAVEKKFLSINITCYIFIVFPF